MRGSDESSATNGAGYSLEQPELTPSKVDALIRLLADEDPKIHAVVREHLIGAFDYARPYLVESSRRHHDTRVRSSASRFLVDMGREDTLREWERFVERGLVDPSSMDLETGVLLISATEYPDLDQDKWRDILDDCGVLLEKNLEMSREPSVVVSKLNHLLFREMGLKGNRQNYYDPQNSYVHRVLERRLGIPISMSVVTLLVAQRIGLELEGVGLPGHFLLRYRSGKKEVYIDPFDGGRVWSLEDCLHHLHGQGYGFREEYFRAFDTREILIRILANLLGVYNQREDRGRCNRVTRMLEVLQ